MSTDKTLLEKETQPSCLGAVSGSLLLYDVEELNNIVNEFNNSEMSLYDFIGRVWNKGYTLGCIDGYKYNDR